MKHWTRKVVKVSLSRRGWLVVVLAGLFTFTVQSRSTSSNPASRSQSSQSHTAVESASRLVSDAMEKGVPFPEMP